MITTDFRHFVLRLAAIPEIVYNKKRIPVNTLSVFLF